MTDKIAVVDLGTNTFQFVIAEIEIEKFKILFEKSLAPKIGKGGISDGVISEEAIDRALRALSEFVEISKNFGIPSKSMYCFGTSAIRNAKNGQEFCEKVQMDLGLLIQVIDGNKEADLIYHGVKYAIEFEVEPYLIMDIGGGSVEFIIANNKSLLWKQSFEIGGQRLMDLFFSADPIPQSQVKRLQNYLEEKLIPLANAIHQYSPKVLVGSAGSFETLVDIYNAKNRIFLLENQPIVTELPKESFYESYYNFLEMDRVSRLNIPGMIELRVDMIVVATVLINYCLTAFGIEKILVSNFALKEGVLAKLVMNEPL